MEVNNLDDLRIAINKYNIPKEICEDVYSRLVSWIMSGGRLNDNYVFQQYKFIENYIKIKG